MRGAHFLHKGVRGIPPLWGGSGAMLLVRGVARSGQDEQDLGFLQTPLEGLARMIDQAAREGWAFVSLAEAARRRQARVRGHFVVMAFEHPWKDTLDVAAPLLRARGTPFVLYSCAADAAMAVELEAALARLDYVEINLRKEMIEVPAGTPAQKRRALRTLLADLGQRPREDAWDVASRLVARAGLEPGFTRQRLAQPQDLAALADDPLCETLPGAPPTGGDLPVVTLGARLEAARFLGPAAKLARALSRARPPSSG